MPPGKKAAKKTARKAAKKASRHHHHSKDLRRAYEHLGRVEILRNAGASSAADALDQLTTLAQKAIQAGDNEAAADLLRALEHLSFAVLAEGSHSPGRISAELEKSISAKFDDLVRSCDEHWQDKQNRSKVLDAAYKSCRKSAAKAFKVGAYHQALEFARAAEALARVEQHGLLNLETDAKALRLKGA